MSALHNFVFSQRNFLSGIDPGWMVKIKNKKRLEWALRQYKMGKEEQKYLAEILGVTREGLGRFTLNTRLDGMFL